jgi:hypothetical protein
MKHLLWVGIVLALVLQPALAQMKGEKMESKKSGSVEDQIIRRSATSNFGILQLKFSRATLRTCLSAG